MPVPGVRPQPNNSRVMHIPYLACAELETWKLDCRTKDCSAAEHFCFVFYSCFFFPSLLSYVFAIFFISPSCEVVTGWHCRLLSPLPPHGSARALHFYRDNDSALFLPSPTRVETHSYIRTFSWLRMVYLVDIKVPVCKSRQETSKNRTDSAPVPRVPEVRVRHAYSSICLQIIPVCTTYIPRIISSHHTSIIDII